MTHMTLVGGETTCRGDGVEASVYVRKAYIPIAFLFIDHHLKNFRDSALKALDINICLRVA